MHRKVTIYKSDKVTINRFYNGRTSNSLLQVEAYNILTCKTETGFNGGPMIFIVQHCNGNVGNRFTVTPEFAR